MLIYLLALDLPREPVILEVLLFKGVRLLFLFLYGKYYHHSPSYKQFWLLDSEWGFPDYSLTDEVDNDFLTFLQLGWLFKVITFTKKRMLKIVRKETKQGK